METKRWRLVWCIVNAFNFIYTMDNEETTFLCVFEKAQRGWKSQTPRAESYWSTSHAEDEKMEPKFKILFLFKLLEVLNGGSIIKSNCALLFFCCNIVIRWFSLLFWKIGLGLNPKLVWFYLAVQFLDALKFKLKFTVSFL